MSNKQSTINDRQRDLTAILKEDYARFPEDQTYEIYAEDVYVRLVLA